MTIYYDPTEVSSSSLTRDWLKRVGIELHGLERATGGDIAIIKDDSNVPPDALTNPESEEIGRLILTDLPYSDIALSVGVALPVVIKVSKFWKATQSLGIIVQRKSGGDLLGSIPKLANILEKMRVWTPSPWLTSTGKLERTSTGTAKINGRVTQFGYSAVVGALDAWQVRGGYITHLADDDCLKDWVMLKDREVNDSPRPPKVVVARPPKQVLVGTDDNMAWISTLMSFKGIGLGMATTLAQTFGSLAHVLCFMSDEKSYSYEHKPDGWGRTTSKNARERLGLEDGQLLEVVSYK